MQKPKPTKMEIQNFQKQCTKNFYNPKNVVHENCIITATAEPLIYYSYEQNNTRSAKANGANGNLGSEQLCQNEQLHHQSHSFPSTGFGFHENYKVSSQRPHINLTRNGNEQQEKKMNEIEKEDDDEENFSDFDHVEDDEENLFDMNPQFLQSYANSNSNSNQIQNTKMKNMKIKEGENENEDEDEDDMGMELDDEDHDDKYNANSNGNIKMKEEGPERSERIEKPYGNMSSIPSSFYDIATPTTITSNIGMGSGNYYIGNYPPPPSYSSYSYAYTSNNNYNYANENVNASELSKNYDILTSPLASQSNQIIEPVKEEEGEEENEQQQLKQEPEQIKSYSETMAEINSMLDPFTFISSHMPLCEIKNDEKEPPHVQKQNEYSQKPNYRPHITNSNGGGNSNANGYGNYSSTAATSNVPTVLSRAVSPTSDTDYYGNLSPISNETSVVSPRTLEELGNIAEALFNNGDVFNNTNDTSPNSSEGENNGDGSLFDSYRNQNQNQNQNSNPHSNIIPMIKKDPTSSMHGMIIPEFQSASSTCSSFSSSSSAPVGGYAQFPPPNISAKTSSIKWENPLTTPISPNCFYDTTIDNSASVVPPASSTGSTNLLVQPPPIPIKLPSILCTPEITDINQQDPRRRSVSNASHRTILFCKKDNAINKSPHGGTPIVARRRHHSFDISALQYCQYPGCNKKKQGSYYCIKHGGGKRCIVEGCTKSIQSNQRCKAHGGGPRCIVPGCTKSSQGNGKCRRHGGGKRCTFVGCEKSAQWGTYCAQHGGSRICNVEGCSKRSRSQNRCAEHGGGKRCVIVECNKPARKGDKCAQHYREYIMQQQNALEVLHKQQQLQLQQQQQHSLERSIHSNERLANGSFMAQLNAFRESGGIHTVPVPSQSLPHPRHQFET